MGPSPHAACAACKFQRRKCAADCPLAPWFPPDQPKRFANVHRLFGVANVLKLLRENAGRLRDLVMSIVYEAEARDRDPIHGSYGVLQLLQREAHALELQRDRLQETWRKMVEVEETARQSMYMHMPCSTQQQVLNVGESVYNFPGNGGLWNQLAAPSAYSEQPEQNVMQYNVMGPGATSRNNGEFQLGDFQASQYYSVHPNHPLVLNGSGSGIHGMPQSTNLKGTSVPFVSEHSYSGNIDMIDFLSLRRNNIY